MPKPCQHEIVDFIDKGIRNAQKDYKKAAWTPIWQGPEYLITASIFYSLLTLTKRDSLTLETRPNTLLGYLTEEARPGRPRSVPRPNGRVDICLWHVGEDRPRAIIEVKRCAEDWIKDTKDVVRVAKLLNARRYRNFEFGILASCMFAKVENNQNESEQDIGNILERVRQGIEEKLDAQGHFSVKLEKGTIKRLPLKDEYPDDEHSENWVWRPVVFKILCEQNRR